MAIEKYTTEAFILREYEQGENDFVYKVWTKEFGIIFVLARSIRKVNAKLRPIAKKNNFVLMTLVKGKEVWRLTGIEENKEKLIENQYAKEVKKIISEYINKYIEEKKTYKNLFEKLKYLIIFEKEKEVYEISKLKKLILFIVLVEAGYANIQKIGIRDLEEYRKYHIKDLYTYFILNEKEISEHLLSVLKISML